MVEVPLTRGLVAIVDEASLPLVSQCKWQAVYNTAAKDTFYARASHYRAGRYWSVYMHRLLTGVEGKLVVDHINRNTLDNRLSNLRICSQHQNLANSKRPTKSGYRGVCFVPKKNRFAASIRDGQKPRRLGYFITAVDAAVAYDRAALEIYGDYAALNFPTAETPFAPFPMVQPCG